MRHLHTSLDRRIPEAAVLIVLLASGTDHV
jgi:hypothetical protein